MRRRVCVAERRVGLWGFEKDGRGGVVGVVGWDIKVVLVTYVCVLCPDLRSACR